MIDPSTGQEVIEKDVTWTKKKPIDISSDERPSYPEGLIPWPESYVIHLDPEDRHPITALGSSNK